MHIKNRETKSSHVHFLFLLVLYFGIILVIMIYEPRRISSFKDAYYLTREV